MTRKLDDMVRPGPNRVRHLISPRFFLSPSVARLAS